MAILIGELARSREQTRNIRRHSNVTLQYIVQGSLDDDEITAAVLEEAPGEYLEMKMDGVHLTPLGGDVWHAEVAYGTVQDFEFSFDTSGGTQHITQSLGTPEAVRRNSADPPPNHKQAIGVSLEGVQGVDIIVPKLEFSVTRPVPDIDLDYIRALRDLTGKVNAAEWNDFPAGELLFMGGQGRVSPDGRQVVTYRFAASKNRENIRICDGLVIPRKLGWEYLWVAYGQNVDGNSLVSQPIAAYVEVVYEPGDFSVIRL